MHNAYERSIRIDRRSLLTKKRKRKNTIEQLTYSARSFAIIAFPFASAFLFLTHSLTHSLFLSLFAPPLHYILFASWDFVQLHRPKLLKYTVGFLILNYLPFPPFNCDYCSAFLAYGKEMEDIAFLNTFKCERSEMWQTFEQVFESRVTWRLSCRGKCDRTINTWA